MFRWKKREAARKEQEKKPPPKPKPKSKPPPSWDDMYESLVRFKAKTGGFLPKSGHLSDWIQAQKDAIEHLSHPQVHKLHELGIKFTPDSVLKLHEAGIYLKDSDDDVIDGGRIDTAAAKSHQKKSRHVEVQVHPTAGSIMYWRSAEPAKLFNFEVGSDIVRGLMNESIC